MSILSELLSFPMISQNDWMRKIGKTNVIKGDLVSLTSAPSSKWYLSWVRDYEHNNGNPKYLLESIDDGELCWWENVGINIYSRERVNERPTWQWDDRQFAFYDKWLKVCYKWNDAYIVLPVLPIFNEDGSVKLDVRVRFSLSEFSNPKTWPNWKKLYMKEMDAYYKESFEKYNNRK